MVTSVCPICQSKEECIYQIKPRNKTLFNPDLKIYLISCALPHNIIYENFTVHLFVLSSSDFPTCFSSESQESDRYSWICTVSLADGFIDAPYCKVTIT